MTNQDSFLWQQPGNQIRNLAHLGTDMKSSSLPPGSSTALTARDATTANLIAAAPALPPDWVELIPCGVFSGRDGRGPFRVGDPQAVIDATMALRMEAGVPIDYDHAIDFAAPLGQPAPAAGWITELAVRDNAIWGRVEWTPDGAEKIRRREYRYLSPVFQFARDGTVVRLLRAGLTNNPNLYLTAICAVNEGDESMEEFLARLRELLGVDQTADCEVIFERIRGLKSAANDGAAAASAFVPDPACYVAMAQFERTLTELNQLRAERARERAERTVDDALRAGRLVPAQREWAISYCKIDERGFREFIERQPAILGLRRDFELPAASAARPASTLTPVERAICAQLGIRIEEFQKRRSANDDFLKINRALD